jgi:aspartate-semialdehyde dehydrogenase
MILISGINNNNKKPISGNFQNAGAYIMDNSSALRGTKIMPPMIMNSRGASQD